MQTLPAPWQSDLAELATEMPTKRTAATQRYERNEGARHGVRAAAGHAALPHRPAGPPGDRRQAGSLGRLLAHDQHACAREPTSASTASSTRSDGKWERLSADTERPDRAEMTPTVLRGLWLCLRTRSWSDDKRALFEYRRASDKRWQSSSRGRAGQRSHALIRPPGGRTQPAEPGELDSSVAGRNSARGSPFTPANLGSQPVEAHRSATPVRHQPAPR